MPFLIKRTYPYALTIYVRWDPSGTSSYWTWTDDRSKAERFESRDSQSFKHAYAATMKDRSDITEVEEIT